MSNTIILKRSSTAGKVPTTSQLALGEMAINTTDGKLFIKKDDGVASVVEIGGVLSVNSKSGTVSLGTDDVAEGSSNQYFTAVRARGALSASTGISYNSSTGAISTVQNISTTATPTFAGLSVNGDIAVHGVVPTASNTYDLGTAASPFRHVYIGPGSLYVNGNRAVTESNSEMTFSASTNQDVRVLTSGTGVLHLGSSSTTVNLDSALQIAAGKRIASSDGVKVQFDNAIELNGNKVIGLGTPTATTDAATKGYVDTAIGNVSTTSISQGNSSVQVVDTGSGTVTVTVDGSTALSVTASGVVISGNMTVNGTTTTVNSSTIALADNIVTLNSNTTGTPTQNAGIEVKRGSESTTSIRWNEGLQKWQFTNDGITYSPIVAATDDLIEGSTNQYFTTARARTALSAGTASGISYNSTSGLFSLGSIPNTSLTNNSITINGAAVALGGTRTLGSDDVAEGSTNQYFTTSRARSAVSVSGTGLSYSSSTGTITYTAPTAPSYTSVTLTGSVVNATDAATKDYVDSQVNAAVISTTDDLSEGSINLYFTDSRAKAAITAGSGITVTNGVVASTITQYTDTMAKAAITAGSGITVTNGVVASTITQYTNAMASAAAPVQSVAGRSGTVTLAVADVSGAAPLASPTFTGTVTAPTFVGALTGTASTATSATTAGTVTGAAQTAITSVGTLTGLTVSGITKSTSFQETRIAMAANNIDLSAANYFTKTISGATTLTVSNVPASGTVAEFILKLTNGGSAVITWFSGVKWASGTAPTLTTAGLDNLAFFTEDGGTTWQGFVLSKDSK